MEVINREVLRLSDIIRKEMLETLQMLWTAEMLTEGKFELTTPDMNDHLQTSGDETAAVVVAAAEEAVDEADLGPEDEEVDPDHAVEGDDLAPDQTQETQEDDPALDQKNDVIPDQKVNRQKENETVLDQGRQRKKPHHLKVDRRAEADPSPPHPNPAPDPDSFRY